MKPPIFALIAGLVVSLAPSKAADSPDAKPADSADAKAPAASKVDSELQALVGKIQTKIKAGQRTEKDLADELKEFDAIVKEHSEEKTDEVANVLLMKAMLYVQVLDNTDKGKEILDEVKKEFPETKPAKVADQIKESLGRQAAAKKIQEGLKVGSPFPNFEVKDLDGNAISVSALKGQIVLIDFWATWCGPCVQELPNVLATYQKYHDKGFSIIGVSLDKDKAALTGFIKEHKMEWPQFFDGNGWQNELAQKYGVNSIPATYLLDKEGNILGKGLRGEKLGEAVEKALGGK